MKKKQRQLEELRQRLNAMPDQGMVEEVDMATEGLNYLPGVKDEVSMRMTQAIAIAKDRIPQSHEAGLLSFREPVISDSEITRYEGELRMIEDPVGTLLNGIETLNLRDGQIKIAQTLYPDIFDYVVKGIIEKVTDIGAEIPYKYRIGLSELFGIPLDPSVTPEVVAGLNKVKQMADAASQSQGSRGRQAKLRAQTYVESEMDSIAQRR